MSTKIKLCGMMLPEDIEAANALQPNYVGFVFAKGSKRSVSPSDAAALRALLAPGITAVGVFVEVDEDLVQALAKDGTIDCIQLHGEPDADTIRRLQETTGLPVMQAFKVQSPEDAVQAENCCADHILFDSGAGSGCTFDWSAAKGTTRPFFLAGGLDSTNVVQAIRQVQPAAVDVSSGIETDGRKDPVKMKEFVDAVRKECGQV